MGEEKSSPFSFLKFLNSQGEEKKNPQIMQSHWIQASMRGWPIGQLIDQQSMPFSDQNNWSQSAIRVLRTMEYYEYKVFQLAPSSLSKEPSYIYIYIYIYIYDELLGYHFVEHMAAVVSSSRQSQLKHEKGMQTCSGNEHGEGKKEEGFLLRSKTTPFYLGLF